MIFISYKTEPDYEFAKSFKDKCESSGFDCWFAQNDIGDGENYAEQIPLAIKKCEFFVLVLTEASQKSPHVKKELNLAVKYKKRIIPISSGEVELTGAFEYYLGDVQIHNLSTEPIETLFDLLRQGTRLYEIQVSSNPARVFTLIRGNFQENVQYMIEHNCEEVSQTVFAFGIDRSSLLSVSASGGIVRSLIDFLQREYNIPIACLQKKINEAKIKQLNHENENQPMEFGDSVVIDVPVCYNNREVVLSFMMVANSEKSESNSVLKNQDNLVGIDSREIILKIFNRFAALQNKKTNLFLGAMGTNKLQFPYEVITAEIINSYLYAKLRNIMPLNLYYSVRQEDMERSGVTAEMVYTYINNLLKFFEKQ